MNKKIKDFIAGIESEIDRFREKNHMSKTKFCVLCTNNPRLLKRIKGENVEINTLSKVLDFIDSYKDTE